MRISNYLTPQPLNYKKSDNKLSNINFKSNPDSKLLLTNPCDFFVRIKGYGFNMDWANRAKLTVDSSSRLIRQNKHFDEILPYIAHGIKMANKEVSDSVLNQHTGRIRTYRPNYGKVSTWGELSTKYDKENKYSAYKKRLDKIIKHPLKNPYLNTDFRTTIRKGRGKTNFMDHGKIASVNPALDIAKNIYENLQTKYISKPQNITDKTLKDINSKVAETRWIIAHSMPWERGSDSIGNTFMRALYKSMGIKVPALKENISLDLEAYCTSLKTYKKRFPTYFEYPPTVVE